MPDNNEPFYFAEKIDESQKYLIDQMGKRLEDLKTDHKNEMEHYATKHFVYGSLFTFLILISTAFWQLTPKIIKSETSKLEAIIEKTENAVQKIIEILSTK